MPPLPKTLPNAIEKPASFAPGDLALTFARMSARRLYIFGGIALIASGLLFGDIFAVFILHQNAARQGDALMAAGRAVAAGNPAAVNELFIHLGNVLEDRGTKVDAHVHMIGAGYLALLLGLVQPYIALSRQTKKSLAALFLTGGAFLPLGIFLIHYIGLTGSPFPTIGWASVLADSAGAVLIFVVILQGWGFWRYICSRQLSEPELPDEDSMPRRALLTGGTLLILAGFLHGAYYAATQLYEHERMETEILQRLLRSALAGNIDAVSAAVNSFGNLAGTRAVNIAAHSHIIEFGLLAMLLSFVQPFVFLTEKWKRRWVKMLLGGSVILPMFVLLEMRLGLIAGGIADVGGLMVLIGLMGMLLGIVRYSGALDFAETDHRANDSARNRQADVSMGAR